MPPGCLCGCIVSVGGCWGRAKCLWKKPATAVREARAPNQIRLLHCPRILPRQPRIRGPHGAVIPSVLGLLGGLSEISFPVKGLEEE